MIDYFFWINVKNKWNNFLTRVKGKSKISVTAIKNANDDLIKLGQTKIEFETPFKIDLEAIDDSEV